MKFLNKIFRFFFPKNFMAELHRGIDIGKKQAMTKNPAYLAGKGMRKIIDPKHKMKFGDKNAK